MSEMYETFVKHLLGTMRSFEAKTSIGNAIGATDLRSPAPWVPSKKIFEGTGVSKKNTNRVR
jgi:hypothetical protein